MFLFQFYSGNVVGIAPYAVGAPSCGSHGMYPSSRYSGLCVSTQTLYTQNHGVITQNTYTLRTERIRPTVYRTVKTVPRYTTRQARRRYSQPHSTAIQVYQQALRAYQNPRQSYESAQQNYQRALQAYSAAYQTTTPTYTYRPTTGYYGAYYG